MAVAVYRRLAVTQLGGALRVKELTDNNFFRSSICLSHLNPPYNRSEFKTIVDLVKTNGKRAFLVDTLAMVRRLEAQGVPSKQAEAITGAIIEVLNDSLENVAQSFVSKGQMQKHHFSLLQCETEKLRGDINKMHSELRYDLDKMHSELRYDLERAFANQSAETSNLTNKLDREIHSLMGELRYDLERAFANQSAETSNLTNKFDREIHSLRGELRYDLERVFANQSAETSNLTNKLDKEIHSLRAQLEVAKYDVIAQLEAAKYDAIKYCIGTVVSISAVGLAIIRIFI